MKHCQLHTKAWFYNGQLKAIKHNRNQFSHGDWDFKNPITPIFSLFLFAVVAVDGPTKPSEVYVLQYAPSEVLSSGPHNEENTAEDETDDIDSDGSGSPELDVNQSKWRL